MIIHGIELVYRPKSDRWVAVLGPDDIVHFHCPTGSRWQARRPMALEPLFTAKTLHECVLLFRQYRDKQQEKHRARMFALLNDPIVQKALR